MRAHLLLCISCQILLVAGEATIPNVKTYWQNMLARVLKNTCEDWKANSSNQSFRVS